MPFSQNARRKIIVREIKVDKVLDINEHVDGGWFWTKYSAAPYMGCQYGCTYCFLREDMYRLNVKNKITKNLEDPFSQFIRVRINAPEILDKELPLVPKDIIVTGDYQPIENKFKLSRKMLEVCLKHEFPTLIIAKSPLILRDLDVIKRISEKSWACVVFSISSTSKSHRESFEPFASSIESRFMIMKRFSEAGIYTGTALMPIFPFITDSDENLETIVGKTKENGGKFILAGGLVLSDSQAEAFYMSLEKYNKSLVEKYKLIYGNQFSPQDNSWAVIGRKVRELCKKYGLDYRIKRFIPDTPLLVNKRIVEQLFLKVYEMELNEENEESIFRYRKLAWFIDEFKEPISNLASGKILIDRLKTDKNLSKIEKILSERRLFN
ncbi:MAG: hypothetical protein HYT70_04335 [Candidatus Aenigmarchaeota archaeon]|nr:hypothetical protein [Candidatus Aenigmarchaeota archaeon]